jgi:hypothetical protein
VRPAIVCGGPAQRRSTEPARANVQGPEGGEINLKEISGRAHTMAFDAPGHSPADSRCPPVNRRQSRPLLRSTLHPGCLADAAVEFGPSVNRSTATNRTWGRSAFLSTRQRWPPTVDANVSDASTLVKMPIGYSKLRADPRTRRSPEGGCGYALEVTISTVVGDEVVWMR